MMRGVPTPDKLAGAIMDMATKLAKCPGVAGLIVGAKDEHGTTITCVFGDTHGIRAAIAEKVKEIGK